MMPALTAYDPAESLEGALDPLGLFAVADDLAQLLAPGIRERHRHPRFLTALSVGTLVCEGISELAADGVSEPWQVYEWYVVEGMVRERDPSKLKGLPGHQKAEAARRAGLPLGAKTYLTAPMTFGFHGVYRSLAEELDIAVDGQRGPVGDRLLAAWEREQGLAGFFGTAGGSGGKKRRMLRDAVLEGLRSGGTERTAQWEGWRFFARHLAHAEIGRREGKILSEAFLDPARETRVQLIRFLTSADGRALRNKTESERAVHKALRRKANDALIELLDAISAYERFARLLQDAFDDCLFMMSQTRSPLSPREISRSRAVRRAVERVPGAFSLALERFERERRAPAFEGRFGVFGAALAPDQWVETLLEHHRQIQRDKPPHGKLNWCERTAEGGYLVRGVGHKDERPQMSDEYVHRYRSDALASMCRDIGIRS